MPEGVLCEWSWSRWWRGMSSPPVQAQPRPPFTPPPPEGHYWGVYCPFTPPSQEGCCQGASFSSSHVAAPCCHCIPLPIPTSDAQPRVPVPGSVPMSSCPQVHPWSARPLVSTPIKPSKTRGPTSHSLPRSRSLSHSTPMPLCPLLVLQSACLLLTLAGTSCRCASGARLSLHRAAPERGGRSRGSSGQHRARCCRFPWLVYPLVSGVPFTAQLLDGAADLGSARIRGTESHRTLP